LIGGNRFVIFPFTWLAQGGSHSDFTAIDTQFLNRLLDRPVAGSFPRYRAPLNSDEHGASAAIAPSSNHLTGTKVVLDQRPILEALQRLDRVLQ
jgi:hypothetical protein